MNRLLPFNFSQISIFLDFSFSRILAEYLGEDQMLALVCRDFEAARALEEYQQNGEIDYTCAVHAKANALGKFIVGRFSVICLENLRYLLKFSLLQCKDLPNDLQYRYLSLS